jgi:hypothetical protein
MLPECCHRIGWLFFPRIWSIGWPSLAQHGCPQHHANSNYCWLISMLIVWTTHFCEMFKLYLSVIPVCEKNRQFVVDHHLCTTPLSRLFLMFSSISRHVPRQVDIRPLYHHGRCCEHGEPLRWSNWNQDAMWFRKVTQRVRYFQSGIFLIFSSVNHHFYLW